MNMKKIKNFPSEFMFGASTSAYQVEGASTINGKGRTMQDMSPWFDQTKYSGFNDAVDHYNRFEEDIELFAEMGLNSYRMSIPWSRIIPDGTGEVNKEAIEHYHKLFDCLLKHKIEPIVTMLHFDIPEVLMEKGSWTNRDVMLPAFERYAKILLDHFGDKVKYWLPINEPNVMVLVGSLLIGSAKSKDEETTIWKDLYQQNHNMLLAQARVITLIHEMCPNAKAGPAPSIARIYPETCKPEDQLASDNANAFRNYLCLDLVCRGKYNNIMWKYFVDNGYEPEIRDGDMEDFKKGKPDFIAFNYYNSSTVSESTKSEFNVSMGITSQKNFDNPGLFDAAKNPYLKNNEYRSDIDPVGLRATGRMLYDRYELPLMITENGLGAKDELTSDGKIHDQYRIDYLEAHLSQIKLLINEGVEFIAYNPWTAIDLVSTHEGVSKRYGFIYVNRDEFDLKDMKRYKKDSFYWYQNVIKTNGQDL